VFFEETPRQAARLASFGRRRLLVVSRDPAAEKDRSAESVAQERAWAREQKENEGAFAAQLAGVARGSGHGVHHGSICRR
jgi:hypothetical protein